MDSDGIDHFLVVRYIQELVCGDGSHVIGLLVVTASVIRSDLLANPLRELSIVGSTSSIGDCLSARRCIIYNSNVAHELARLTWLWLAHQTRKQRHQTWKVCPICPCLVYRRLTPVGCSTGLTQKYEPGRANCASAQKIDDNNKITYFHYFSFTDYNDRQWTLAALIMWSSRWKPNHLTVWMTVFDTIGQE